MDCMFAQLHMDFDSRMFNSAVEFFTEILDLKDTMPIKIEVVDNIGRGRRAAECGPKVDKDFNVIGIDIKVKRNASMIGMIDALAHEMVHAKQFIRGEATFEVEKKFLLGFIPTFKIKKFWGNDDVTDLSYYEQPAEMEAHLLQKYLTTQYLKHIEDKIEPKNLAKLFHASMTKAESTNDQQTEV